MKVCVAQIKPVNGDIQSNIGRHKKFIGLAASRRADIIIFPELSLTGYEPGLAKQLAIDESDELLNDLQVISDDAQIMIGAGIPTQGDDGICISMLLFQPDTPRQRYSKQYLHPDEQAFFVSGQGGIRLIGDPATMALAICYELSVPEHAEHAARAGAEIYIASVAKHRRGVEQAAQDLSAIARRYSMTVLMANCIGVADGDLCAGQSSVWNNQGLLLGQLGDSCEGILLIDTNTQVLFEEIL